jgi:hypothetical protein
MIGSRAMLEYFFKNHHQFGGHTTTNYLMNQFAPSRSPDNWFEFTRQSSLGTNNRYTLQIWLLQIK